MNIVFQVSLDSRVREVINRNMVDPTPHTFDEAQLQIYTLMHRDSYPRFLNSQIYKKLIQQYSWSRMLYLKLGFFIFVYIRVASVFMGVWIGGKVEVVGLVVTWPITYLIWATQTPPLTDGISQLPIGCHCLPVYPPLTSTACVHIHGSIKEKCTCIM